MTELPPVGWREWVALPTLGVGAIKAKVDTGARSAVLHAFDVEEIERDGESWLRFSVHPFQEDDSVVVVSEARWTDQREVRSSNGETEHRPFIVTDVVLCGVRYEVELGLSRRDEMGFRMLLGRRALRRRFVVDAGRSFIGGGSRFVPPA